MASIKVHPESAYGKDFYYPACDKAQLFCIIAGREKPSKTLTPKKIEAIKALGFEVKVVPRVTKL